MKLLSTAAEAARVKRILSDWGFVGYPVVDTNTYDPENGFQEINLEAEPQNTVKPYAVLVFGDLKPVSGAGEALDRNGSPSWRVEQMFQALGMMRNNNGGPNDVQKAYAAWEALIKVHIQ